ncbi:hypothetical protein DMB99_16965 [Proteus mirabilis]|uniref:DUF4393 domain-containing protein n=1 Tax=Proteus mirabilis TaxID=584 RepID=UPI000D737464|nr:DUF4393 domain-containing protein [Proteus mirabilis]EKW2646104.1 DUF4393 domain-containing protein [Proteus mirabilis]ELA7721626.1 DUF4393 domain-containing protein [Proteus mirabilis]ELA9909236.1 DUF4393 domain-containing protein [Proteus mirabilis]MDC9764261.1 DUF4393 domain-containing protein [Proteus mirabilis]PXA24108.1 hypothetical protein DMB99_16965 [Proteus mirabilis]
MIDKSAKVIVEKLAVPIYEDALSPFAKELSKGLVSVAKIVNSGVFLVEDSIHAMTNVLRMTAENLALLPPKQISFDQPRIALQALNEAKFAINEDEIQRLFSNLISTSLDKKTSKFAHPAYIEIIKQLQPDEARILQFMFNKENYKKGHAPIIDVIQQDLEGSNFSVKSVTSEVNLICEDADCDTPKNSLMYFFNLKRLGLLTVTSGTSFPKEEHERIFLSEKVKEICSVNLHLDKVSYQSGQYSFTGFGSGFVDSCVGRHSN